MTLLARARQRGTPKSAGRQSASRHGEQLKFVEAWGADHLNITNPNNKTCNKIPSVAAISPDRNNGPHEIENTLAA